MEYIPIGYYQNANGQSSCKQCDPGNTYSNFLI